MNLNKTFIVLIVIFFFLSFINNSFLNLLSLIFLIYMIWLVYKKFKDKQVVENNNHKNIARPITENVYYEIKNFLSPSEFVFYHKLINVNKDFIIIPQVPLASIVKKVNAKYQNELNRIIDFGIFDKNFNLLLLIELNDYSHNKIYRKDRDLKVKKILDDCYIKLLTFYTKYPNEQEYIIKRINETLNIKNES